MEWSKYQNKLVPYLRMVCLKNNSLAPVAEKVDNAVKWINLYPSISKGVSVLWGSTSFIFHLSTSFLGVSHHKREEAFNPWAFWGDTFYSCLFSLRLKNLLQKNLTSLLEVTIKKLSLPQQKEYTCLRSVWNLSSMTK